MENSSTSFNKAFRNDLTEAIKASGFRTDEIKEISKSEFAGIVKKIRIAFTNIPPDMTESLWKHLSSDNGSIQFKAGNAFQFLNDLVPPKEGIWFIASDRLGKYWLFEGFIEPVQIILGNLYGFEYYIVSKKYEWLLCENQHGNLIGTGEKMIARMKDFIEKNEKEVLQAFNL